MSRQRAEAASSGLAPPSTETLRRSALARSQRRGEQVARRRLAWRWTLWAMGRAARWAVLPLLALALLGGLAWWWLADEPAQPAATPLPPPRQTAASAPAALALPPAPPALPLRMDDGDADPASSPGRAQSDTSLPHVDDRSSQ